MKRFVEIIKGFFIGAANVLPSVSGSTLAVILKIYDKLIIGINDFFKHPLKFFKEFGFLIIGIIIGAIAAIILLAHLYEYNPLPITFLFLGFILGGIPLVYQETKHESLKKRDWVVFLIAFILVSLLPLMNKGEIKDLEFNFLTIVLLLILGILLGPTLIIPGISGSVILMAIGFYEPLLEISADFFKSLLSFDFNSAKESLSLGAPFGIGLILGIIITCRFLKKLFATQKSKTYLFILGLTVAAPIPIISNLKTVEFKPLIWLVSCLLFVIGAYIPKKLESLGEKREKEISESK